MASINPAIASTPAPQFAKAPHKSRLVERVTLANGKQYDITIEGDFKELIGKAKENAINRIKEIASKMQIPQKTIRIELPKDQTKPPKLYSGNTVMRVRLEGKYLPKKLTDMIQSFREIQKSISRGASLNLLYERIDKSKKPPTETAPMASPSKQAAIPVEKIREQAMNGPIYFYDAKAGREDTQCFGNSFQYPITYNEIIYPNAQAAYQAQFIVFLGNKCTSLSAELRARITEMAKQFENSDLTGKEAIALADKFSAEIKVFPGHDEALAEWGAAEQGRRVRNEAMYYILTEKFSDGALKEALLATGNAYLCAHLPASHSPSSSIQYWTDGGDATQPNMLGRFLMLVRENLRDPDGESDRKLPEALPKPVTYPW